MARLEREAEERNKQRQQEEHEQIKRRHVKERLDELRKTPQGSKILQNIDEEVIYGGFKKEMAHSSFYILGKKQNFPLVNIYIF